MSKFEGRVAVVTGAGSGIGRALAQGLARRGALLAVSDVDDEGLAETVALLEGRGIEVYSATVDVSDWEAVQAHAAAVADHFGSVNQIFNNAGVASARTVLESDIAEYERVLNVNLWGVIYGTKAFLPYLIDSGEGHVVNISSLNGLMAQGMMSQYCTAKFGVRGFTESLHIEMLEGELPVAVTCVYPGGVNTNIATNTLLAAKQLGQIVTADDEARTRRYNEKLLTMPAETAADIILNGVARNRARVIVGREATILDFMVRQFPSRYLAFMGRHSQRLGLSSRPREMATHNTDDSSTHTGSGSVTNTGTDAEVSIA